jgi:hypothetical protein
MFVMEGESSHRKCGRCGELKPLNEFAWRRKRKIQRDSFCRPCRSAYGREHYLANRQRYIDQAAVVKRKRLRERTLYLLEYFKTHPCVDCGEDDPVVLEFDHLGEKLFDIGREIHNRGWQSILDEIAKCEVVCANCHRRRTARRRGALRLLLSENLNVRQPESGRPDLNRHRDLGRVLCNRYTTPARERSSIGRTGGAGGA